MSGFSGNGLLKNKYDATIAPTVNDDITLGYSIGSNWVDVTNDNVYVCVDITATAAVWIQTNASASLFTTVTNTASDTAFIEFNTPGSGSYELIIEDSIPATDLQPLLLQVFIVSYQTTLYKTDRSWSNNNAVGGNRFTSSIRLSDGDGSAAGEGSSGFMKFGRMNTTDTYKKFAGMMTITGSLNNTMQAIGGNYQGGQGAITKIKILYNTGNIASGTFKLRSYGAN